MWGVLSGLGLALVPWLAAAVISTASPDPEAVFLWALGGAVVPMIAWIAYGSVRLPGFRRGALVGVLIALAGAALLYVLLRWPP